MTMKSDAKFKEKLICGLKKDIRNLVYFHASSRKSENLHFDQMLLSRVQMKKYRRVSLMTQKNDAKFEGKVTLGSRNDMRNQVNFISSGESLKTFTLIGYFCRKYVMLELKNIEGLCRQK